MVLACVHVSVKSEHVDDFIAATKRNHLASIREPGNLRFDVSQRPDDPTKFLLYEAYETPEAAAAHKETAHYAAWRDTVADMMAEPRSSIKCANVYPDDEGWG